MVRLCIFLLFSLVSFLAHAEDPPLKFCYVDHSMSPWVIGTNQGLVISAIRKAEKELHQTFELVRLPWKRCLNEVKEGRIQAAIGASYLKERASWGSYPTTAQGRLNKDLRLFNASFYLYKRVGSEVRWHDQQLMNLEQQHIGIQLGYSVGRELEKHGYPITYLPASDDLVNAFRSGELDFIVLESSEAKRIISTAPSLKNTIIRDDEPIMVAEQFLLFNTNYYLAHQAQVNTIWETLARIRKSRAYQMEAANALKFE